MRFRAPRLALALLVGLGLASCSEQPTATSVVSTPATASIVATPSIVISQLYGGGGNSGATYRNDFIELFNPGGVAVSVAGWSVQYASAAGTSWQVTNLTGSIPAGGYYLVQESQGAGGTTALPTPEVSGTIAMSATAGKVFLVSSTTALSGACPAGAIDQVSFGSTASDCGIGRTATLTNTTADIRGNGGCSYTPDLSADFAAAAPTPRNSASPVHLCPNVQPVGPLDHVAIAGASVVIAGNSIQLTATPQDIGNQAVSGATITWSTADPTIATVSTSGLVTGVTASATPVAITAQAVANGITRSASVQITVNSPGINWVDISSSSTSFPPGFQTQMFATARVSQGGAAVPATFTFEAVDPSLATIATVQNTGIVTGVSSPADGTTRPGFRVTAVPVGGGTPYVFITHTIFIEAPHTAPFSIYGHNDEFGDPSPASPGNPNDLLIVRPQYTLGYNTSHGTPNWVSYELDSRQMVAGQDRCNCFTAEGLIPAINQIFTSDYTNGGYDRGHMARSADRTAANVDNATTFYLSNIVPQMADLNQGVWAQFENALADSAQAGRAVYIITGPLYSSTHGLTFLKNEGKVAIPDSTWKVAFIGPRIGGSPFARPNVQSWDDLAGLTVLAVNMPNVAGVRNDPWSKYLTTVDKVEAATGLNLLSLLQTSYQDAVEAGDRPPVAQFSRSGTANEGSTLSFDASASSDPDLGRSDLGRTEALSYDWQFSDGGTASGKVVSHVFADNGIFTATLTVSDAFGWQKRTSQNVVVSNVAPSVNLGATTSTTILSGEAVSVTGGFSDPGSDAPWNASLNWGNGTIMPFVLNTPGSNTVSATATYLASGTYTVTLTVTDKDGAPASQSLTVYVNRRPVAGASEPAPLGLGNQGNGEVKITLYSDSYADMSTLDLSTVRIGGVSLSNKKVKIKSDNDTNGRIVLRFERQDLLASGMLTPSTTELVVTGTLANGMQIVATVPFSTH